MVNIIDISLPISPEMPVYPGNQMTEFHEHIKPSGSRLTTVVFDTHAGTHIDAPRHSLGDVGDVDSYELDAFFGVARVIECMGDRVDRSDLEKQNIHAGERILIKTRNSERGYARFYDSWVGLTGDAAEYLANQKVSLVGFDWFGVKEKDANDNRAHTELLEKNIPILEGIDLSEARSKSYQLSALPLKIIGSDGAHARAVLVENI